MNKEQWEIIYNDLYYLMHQFKKVHFDVFWNEDISKSKENMSKLEMKQIMSTAYSKIYYIKEVRLLFEKSKNIGDLKDPDHFEYTLSPFISEVEELINNL